MAFSVNVKYEIRSDGAEFHAGAVEYHNMAYDNVVEVEKLLVGLASSLQKLGEGGKSK